MKCCAILMAAGESTRLKKDKALLTIYHTTFIEYIINVVVKSNVTQVKAVANQKVYDFLSQKKLDKKVEILLNRESSLGQSGSIKIGIHGCENADAFMFVSVDQPFLTSRSIDMVIDNFQKDSIVVPRFSGKQGLPTLFDKHYKRELLAVRGDMGGRNIIKKHKDCVVYVDIDNAQEGFDIDTKEDLRIFKEITQWKSF